MIDKPLKNVIVEPIYSPSEKRQFFCSYIRAFDINAKFCAIGCGMWTCESCREYLSYKLKQRIQLGLTTLTGNWQFITFTQPGVIGGHELTVEDAYRLLPQQWDKYRNLVRNALGGSWEYIAVVEGQPKRGFMPHFHIISNRTMPDRFAWRKGKTGKLLKTDIKDIAVHCGFGYQANCQTIDLSDPDKVATYASKMGRYLSKDSAHAEPPKGFRRIRASRNWPDITPGIQKQLLLRKKNESLPDYLIRVSYHTRYPYWLIEQRWIDGMRNCED